LDVEEGQGSGGDQITCIRLGKKSGRVFATGGDDSKVNVFAVGNHEPLMVKEKKKNKKKKKKKNNF
jgi:hypothetical protein